MLTHWVFSRRERGSGCSLYFLCIFYYQAGNGLRLEMGPEWKAGRKRGYRWGMRGEPQSHSKQAGKLGIGGCCLRARRPVERWAVCPERH